MQYEQLPPEEASVPRSLDSDPIHALAAPDAQHNPFLVYAPLLEQRPVFWYEPLHSWVLTRYTDWTRVGETVPPAARSIQSLDPPEQTPVRRLFVEAVRASHDDAVRDEVARQATARLDVLASR